MPDTASGANPRRLAVALGLGGLVLGAACIAAELLSGFGSRWGWWHYSVGFVILRWAAGSSLAVVLLSLVGAILAGRAGAMAALAAGIAGVALAVPASGLPAYYWYQGRHLPHIHDITTDTDDPPRFVAVLPLRRDARNPAEYGGAKIAEQQKQDYPDIVPAVLAAPPAAVFERALAAARAMGWEFVAAAPGELRIEATDTTLFYGFKDDVVIRIAPAAGGSRVDVRSLSRVGGGDFGANAKRVRAFLRELTAPHLPI
ncbi:MAG: DUF1499 domain-containing protein [Burkholderiales bacterium]